MVADRVVAGFVLACEEVADTLRDRISSIEHEVDIELAAPEMLSYIASWLGAELETIVASDDPEVGEAQRRLIRAIGQVLGWRGTRRGVEILLEALTGSRVQVSDSGGVFGRRDGPRPPDDVVRIEITDSGGLSENQIRAFLEDELPVGARVELTIRTRFGGVA
jgi:phage tail-like protein